MLLLAETASALCFFLLLLPESTLFLRVATFAAGEAVSFFAIDSRILLAWEAGSAALLEATSIRLLWLTPPERPRLEPAASTLA